MRLALAVCLLSIGSTACRSPECAAGLFLVEGACQQEPPDCGSACRLGEACDASGGALTCVCAPGYDGEPCEWVGVIGDPLFEGTQNGDGDRFWLDNGGATVLPRTDGPNGGGEGFLAPSVVCNAGALSQMVRMPSHASAGPLVVDVTYKTENVERFAVGFGRTWTELPATDARWETARFCLGEGAYGPSPAGGPVEIQLSSSEKSAPCFEAPQRGTIRIDRFVIEPPSVGEVCAPPSSVSNGEANIGDGGWRFVPAEDPEASLVAGAGREGTDGVRLFRPAGSTAARAATTTISVGLPSTLAAPALRFWWWGTNERTLQVEAGPFIEAQEPWRSIDRLVGDDAEHSSLYCLPPWTHGNLFELTFSLVDEGPVEATTFRVDSIELVSDPDCGTATDVLDPGFESAPNAWFGAYIVGPLGQSVRMVSDVGRQTMRARSGDGALELSYETNEAQMRMETFVLVPEAQEDQCPQVKFHSDVPAEPEATVKWVLGQGDAGPSRVLQSGGSWAVNDVPLPPEWANRWFRVQVRVEPSGAPSAPVSAKRIFLDDFEVTTTSCPPSMP